MTVGLLLAHILHSWAVLTLRHVGGLVGVERRNNGGRHHRIEAGHPTGGIRCYVVQHGQRTGGGLRHVEGRVGDPFGGKDSWIDRQVGGVCSVGDLHMVSKCDVGVLFGNGQCAVRLIPPLHLLAPVLVSLLLLLLPLSLYLLLCLAACANARLIRSHCVLL